MESNFYCYCGPTGSGKTANMVARAVEEMINLERFYFVKNKINEFNSQGFKYGALPQSHIVYANLNITADASGGGFKKNYALNPYRMVLPNKNVPYDLYFPAPVFAVTESQIYWPSYNDKKIAMEKYHFFQNHRHFWALILFDVQFVFNLAKPVRDLVKIFSRCLKIEQKLDKNGRAIETIFHNLEFATADAVEDFEQKKSSNYNLDKNWKGANFTIKRYPFDVFKCYSAWSNFYYFLPKEKEEVVRVYFIENAPDGFFENPDIKKVG